MNVGEVDVRTLLFGSKLRVVGVVFSLLVATVGGAFLAGAIGTPAVVAVENQFGPVDDTETVVYTDLVVNNPNPAGITRSDTTVNYSVSMNDVGIAGGNKRGLAIQPGNTTLEFTTAMENEKIPQWWYTHVSADHGGGTETTVVSIDGSVRDPLLPDRPIDVTQEQTVRTDIIGQFNSDEERPIDADSPVVSDPILVVQETSASWGEVSPDATPVEMGFTLHNPKTTPFTVAEIGYEITMNDVLVGEGRNDDPLVIPGGATKTLDTRTTINNTRLDDWWVSHLDRNQVTELRIDFYALVELPTGTARVPLDALTYEKTIETDIFGNKNEPAPDRADDSRNGSETDGTGTSTTTEPTSGTSPAETAETSTAESAESAGTSTTATAGSSTTTTAASPATTTEDGGLFAVDAPDLRVAARSAPTADT